MGESLIAAFADELSAHRYIEQLLWPAGPVCPHCRVSRVGRLDGASTRLGSFKCYGCRRIFSIAYGTIFERSHVPLHKWLQALYLTSFGPRCRASDLARILNVTCKTAVTMLRRLEQAQADGWMAAEADLEADTDTALRQGGATGNHGESAGRSEFTT
ncbi:MAG: transposase [Proteobacteria bacterium]|nr:transposase [Pseudomonadota bacterium]